MSWPTRTAWVAMPESQLGVAWDGYVLVVLRSAEGAAEASQFASGPAYLEGLAGDLRAKGCQVELTTATLSQLKELSAPAGRQLDSQPLAALPAAQRTGRDPGCGRGEHRNDDHRTARRLQGGQRVGCSPMLLTPRPRPRWPMPALPAPPSWIWWGRSWIRGAVWTRRS